MIINTANGPNSYNLQHDINSHTDLACFMHSVLMWCTNAVSRGLDIKTSIEGDVKILGQIFMIKLSTSSVAMQVYIINKHKLLKPINQDIS